MLLSQGAFKREYLAQLTGHKFLTCRPDTNPGTSPLADTAKARAGGSGVIPGSLLALTATLMSKGVMSVRAILSHLQPPLTDVAINQVGATTGRLPGRSAFWLLQQARSRVSPLPACLCVQLKQREAVLGFIRSGGFIGGGGGAGGGGALATFAGLGGDGGPGGLQPSASQQALVPAAPQQESGITKQRTWVALGTVQVGGGEGPALPSPPHPSRSGGREGGRENIV